ncbi:hypothetical protein ACFYMO_31325 [Streptomyces sp. NPDC007025]|uniref:hypothetical protein n=1 Tax=Streptomyces sp. NPDC007025 TaxID=3364771 RepID=UPI0003F9BC69
MNRADTQRIAEYIAEFGIDYETVTTADMYAAAEYVGVDRPESRDDVWDIRSALAPLVPCPLDDPNS